MIPLSTISQQAKTYIVEKLRELATKEDIQIFIAIESGSRAWGFPSINSDYDVRFIYMRKKSDYLSIVNHRDVIEIDITDNPNLGAPFDLNGWDIRKALLLATKSNAVIIEWLNSPIAYIRNDTIVQEVLTLVQKTANIPYLKNHYFKLMMYAWEQIKTTDNNVKVKLYCYALRPALVLHWLNQYNTPAPMDMFSLCNGIKLPATLVNEISQLIILKTTIEEQKLIPRNQIIDNFIAALAQKKHEKIILPIDPTKVDQANTLFQHLLGNNKRS